MAYPTNPAPASLFPPARPRGSLAGRLIAALLRPLVMGRIAAFERRYRYRMDYARQLYDASPAAFWQLAKLFGIAGGVPGLSPAMLVAAKFAATRREDCGPCAQLVLDLALEAGVPAAALRALVAGDATAMPEDMRLAWRYAEAALARDPESETHARALGERLGPQAVAGVALALGVARTFPTLKYALGHGRSCQRLVVGADNAGGGEAQTR